MTRHEFSRLTAMFFAASIPLCTAVAAEPLRFAPLPMESPETVASQWKPALDHLSRAIGQEVRFEYSDSYAEIIEKLRSGRLDLAYLGPLPYVALKEKFAAAEPVVRFNEANGKDSYTCALVALEERRLAPARMRGLKVALTQPLSTCGYLSTDGLLHQGGGDLEHHRYRYLDKHDAVALAVARGEFDLGGLKTAIGRKYAHLGLAILAETAPLPGFALIAHGERLGAARIEAIRQAFLRAEPAQRAGWGENIRHGAVPAADSDYAAVRELRRRTDIPQQGNF